MISIASYPLNAFLYGTYSFSKIFANAAKLKQSSSKCDVLSHADSDDASSL